ncbi:MULTISPECIES: hypothetical protein [unclassified Streptomyces]|uniref:hypothetical protein n=1 Tax=unclassified Streptomyces TaxID=2593676 RepID=UPI0011B05B0C|nr:hypothetical protein [Streptomyces sp. SM10]
MPAPSPEYGAHQDSEARQKAINGERSPLVAMAQIVGRNLLANRQEKKRVEAHQAEPRWSVRRASDTAEHYLDEVARHCVGSWKFDARSQAQLVGAVPDLETPLRQMADACAAMRESDLLWTRLEAGRLIEPALLSAYRIEALVASSFRIFPARADLPWMGMRVTSQQRARGLERAVASIDEAIGSWHTFAFTHPEATEYSRRLEALAANFGAEAEARELTLRREECLTLATAAKISRNEGREVLRRLSAALDALESALYRGVLGEERPD